MRPVQKQTRPNDVFSHFTNVHLPEKVTFNTGKNQSQQFSIKFCTDGKIPYPQIIIRINGQEHIFNNEKIKPLNDNEYQAVIPDGILPTGSHQVQIEGCRKKEWQNASGDDWIKWFGEINVVVENPAISNSGTSATTKKKN